MIKKFIRPLINQKQYRNKFFMDMSLYKQFCKVWIKIPSLGDSVSSGVILKNHKNKGEFVKVDDILTTLETDKTSVDIRADKAGVITQVKYNEEDEVEVGAQIVEIDTSQTQGSAPEQKEEIKEEKPEPKKEEPKVNKEEVKEKSINEENKKTEPKQEAPKKATKQEATQITSDKNVQSFQIGRTEKKVKLNKMRQTIAKRLKDSQNENVTLTTFSEVDMSAAMNLRAKYQENFTKKHGIKLGLMSFFLKASTIALQENPVFNSVIENNSYIVQRNYVDISVAVASPNGLLVPVIRNCSSMDFAAFEKELSNLGKKAREGKIALEDMQGGTFSVSNGGVYGSLFGTPIINPPQTAILGMHNIVNRPVVVGKEIVARPIMFLALSYDHRLVDGREAVVFLQRIKDLIESPEKMLIDA